MEKLSDDFPGRHIYFGILIKFIQNPAFFFAFFDVSPRAVYPNYIENITTEKNKILSYLIRRGWKLSQTVRS